MDRLAAMQTFVRVVESGSFSAVAREAQATQSAVSKQVAALERALGARLLTRTTRALALTEEGERYFEQARRLVAEIAEAESGLRQGEQQLSGWLRVAASVGFGRLKLMPLVKTFLAEHPGVRIDLRLDDGFIDLVEQGIDVAVRIGELADSTLVARRIGTTKRALIASRKYLRSLPKGQKTQLHRLHRAGEPECLDLHCGAGGARGSRYGGDDPRARQPSDQQQRGGEGLGAFGHGDRVLTHLAVRGRTGAGRSAGAAARLAGAFHAGAPGQPQPAAAVGEGQGLCRSSACSGAVARCGKAALRSAWACTR
jgi:DNA-binding transcriptional LysR family regulator